MIARHLLDLQLIKVEHIPLVAAVLILYVFCRLLATRYLHLRTIPGPKWAPFTRLWMLRTLASENSSRIYVGVNNQYGLYFSLSTTVLFSAAYTM